MGPPLLNVFIVWHPGFAEGATTADSFYRALSRDPDKPLAPGMGIPVYFRTSRNPAETPAEVDLGRAHHTVVVFLVDRNLALVDAWVEYARRLAEAALASGGRHLTLPIQLLKRTEGPNFGTTQYMDLNESMPKFWPTMLRLRVMAEICRLLQDMPRGGPGDYQLSRESVRLFLSHAKLDGEDEAEEMLAKIRKTPLLAFFDQAHIASGYDFSEEILANIERSAMVVLQSDAYSSRPWCRREILAAKRYERPIVVVQRMKLGEARSFPYLGNVPTVCWKGDNHFEIIEAVVREFLRKLYIDAQFKNLEETGEIASGGRHLIRPPELIDGLLFQLASSGSDAALKQVVTYPDPPLSNEETETLAEFFPQVKFETPTTSAGTGDLRGRTIGISISQSEDLLERGFGPIHYTTAGIEVARHVLARGGSLAYGGDLRSRREGGHTDQLFELVRAYREAGIAPLGRVINYLAWHTHVDLDPGRELELRKVATLEKVPMLDGLAAKFRLDESKPLNLALPVAAYARARSLTDMRRRMNDAISARVVLGGLVTGFSGKYPGILEEAYLALTTGKPLYLLGAFGGCAGLLVGAVRGKTAQQFTEQYQIEHSKDAAYGRLQAMYEEYKNDSDIGDDPINYGTIVRAFQEAGIAGLKNGLNEDDNHELFVTDNLDRTIYLLIKGLTAVLT